MTHPGRSHDADSDTAPAGEQTREGQTPLLLQDMQFSEEAVSPPSAARKARPAVVAGLIVAAAFGALFAMRHFGLGPAVSLAEVAVEYKPENSTDAAASAKVLADLERSRRAVQVPAEKITKDPFELLLNNTADEPAVDHDLARRAELERQRLAREARQRELEDVFNSLQLQSVMLGSVPIARINGQIYKPGMIVAELFVVERIESRQVGLYADGQEFVLDLDAEAKPRRNRR